MHMVIMAAWLAARAAAPCRQPACVVGVYWWLLAVIIILTRRMSNGSCVVISNDTQPHACIVVDTITMY